MLLCRHEPGFYGLNKPQYPGRAPCPAGSGTLRIFVSKGEIQEAAKTITHGMKLGVLCSGGKDSWFACHLAMQKEEVACLILVRSKNEERLHVPHPQHPSRAAAGRGCGAPARRGRDRGDRGGRACRSHPCHPPCRGTAWYRGRGDRRPPLRVPGYPGPADTAGTSISGVSTRSGTRTRSTT